ncbi:MAG: efflux RND transporter periplasmic adaptor subunit [Lautropia sp.]
MRRYLLIAIVLIATFAAGFMLLRPSPVALVAAVEAPLVESLLFTGRVGAQSLVELGATTTGRVERVLVREGDFVTRGQRLAELDSDEARAQLAQAEAALEGARARVAALGELSRPTAESGRAQAQATLSATRAEYERTKTLVEQGFISQARLDEVRRQVAVAQAQVDAASAQVRANAPAGSEAELARLKVSEALAARELAESRVDAMRLIAPAAGRVITRSVEPGQVVQPGRVLFTMTVEGRDQLIALVDERYLGRLRQGQAARVLADAYPTRPFDATVATIAPGVDAARGAVEVKLDVAQPPDFLRQDMTVSIEVILGRRDTALTVPIAALRDGAPTAGNGVDTRGGVAGSSAGSGAVVWQLVGGRIVETPVTTGLRDQSRIEITAGLARGARVVVGTSPAPGKRAREASGGGAQPASNGGGFNPATVLSPE